MNHLEIATKMRKIKINKKETPAQRFANALKRYGGQAPHHDFGVYAFYFDKDGQPIGMIYNGEFYLRKDLVK